MSSGEQLASFDKEEMLVTTVACSTAYGQSQVLGDPGFFHWHAWHK
jgi:hypothetical protein